MSKEDYEVVIGLEYAVKAGLATGCSIARDSKNDRKNYFYPDLPKSYQISQFDKPLCEHGEVEIEEDGEKKKIGITRIHIEEDAGKLNHNVSVRKKGAKEFGTRTEMKNMNSFRSIVRAIEYESERQIEVIEEGGTITQETLRWDDVSGKTFSMRDKEDAQDYRYFPEPDLVPIEIDDAWIERVRQSLPELPEAKKARYMSEYKLPEYDVDIITGSKDLVKIFEEAYEVCNNAKEVSNWIMGEVF